MRGGEIMEQKYEIEATVNGEVLVCQSSIESKNGVNQNMARIICNEFKKKISRNRAYKAFIRR